jgi:hypothetical protein
VSDSPDSPKPTNPTEQPQPVNDQPDASPKEQGAIVSDRSDSSQVPDVAQPAPLVNNPNDANPKASESDMPEAAEPDKSPTLPKPPDEASKPTQPKEQGIDGTDSAPSTRMPEFPRQTQLLSDHADTGPMEQREPRPGTTQLGPGWRLRFKINDQTTVLDIGGRVVVGRIIEDETGVDFDLTPFGAYHYGVSRQHAILSLHDGFLYLEDNGSTNGTRINGFQMTPHQKYRLRDSDEIEFARLRTSIRFERPGGR